MHEADLSYEEVRRRTGGVPASGTEAVRHRLAALMDVATGGDDAPLEEAAGDPRVAGALIVRLGGSATTASLASWLGWTLERATAAVAELDRCLDACGLRVHADSGGHLRIRERARLRTRAEHLPSELLARLDAPEHRHALAHLVRGDRCTGSHEGPQALLDLGAAVIGPRGPAPAGPLAKAFGAVYRRQLEAGGPTFRVIRIENDAPGAG